MKRLSPYWYVALAILLILAALTWWYLALRSDINTITAEDASRGAGEEAPTFGSRIGSTYENIVSSAASLIRGNEAQEADAPLPRLARINATPTAGMGFTGRGEDLRLRFVERSTGYVLDADVQTGSLTRLTNTLAPRTYEALVSENRVIMRALEENGALATVVATFSASSTATSSPPLISSKRLPDNITALALSPDGKEIFHLSDTATGAAGVRTDLASGKERTIFTSLLTKWQVMWPQTDRLLVYPNASGETFTYVYDVGKDGTLAPLLRNVRGALPLLHPAARTLVYSGAGGALLARPAGAADIVLPVRTVAEKCVWAPGGNVLYCAVPARPLSADFLDAWYRGEVHTSDMWWRIDVSANSAEQLYASNSVELDVEKPLIDSSGTYITFLNARDKSLWLLRISE